MPKPLYHHAPHRVWECTRLEDGKRMFASRPWKMEDVTNTLNHGGHFSRHPGNHEGEPGVIAHALKAQSELYVLNHATA